MIVFSMIIRNLELKELPDLLPSREGVRKQLRNGRGVLYAMFDRYSFQKSNCYRFTNTPLQPHSLPAPSQEGNKNQIADNHSIFILNKAIRQYTREIALKLNVCKMGLKPFFFISYYPWLKPNGHDLKA
jgi:hypothetical protein